MVHYGPSRTATASATRLPDTNRVNADKMTHIRCGLDPIREKMDLCLLSGAGVGFYLQLRQSERVPNRLIWFGGRFLSLERRGSCADSYAHLVIR